MKPDPTAARAFDRALDLVAFLRAGCPWDAAQTPESLVPYLLEEAAETAEAILDGATGELPGELGDLLLNVAFQTVVAEERGTFTRDDVIGRLETKMRRRHPQLYGDGPAVPWEQLKAAERAEAGPGAPLSILHALPRGLDPLSRAQRIQDRVSAVGFDWPDTDGAFDKVSEELEEVREALANRLVHRTRAHPATSELAGAGGDGADLLEEELGDLLFAVVNLARLSGTHAHRALQRANAKFMRRFERLETLAAERGVVLGEASLEALDEVWDEVKREERRDRER
jgi:nucleoside triphosphate diphosphatase